MRGEDTIHRLMREKETKTIEVVKQTIRDTKKKIQLEDKSIKNDGGDEPDHW